MPYFCLKKFAIKAFAWRFNIFRHGKTSTWSDNCLAHNGNFDIGKTIHVYSKCFKAKCFCSTTYTIVKLGRKKENSHLVKFLPQVLRFWPKHMDKITVSRTVQNKHYGM